MLILIEGSRNTGKTYLMDAFFKQNTNPRVMYYKFQLSKYVTDLGLIDQETGPGVHYFSIANVMTIFELNSTVFKDKILLFDRSIFSAYVWSIYRRRMHTDRLLEEFGKILDSDLYHDVSVIDIRRGKSVVLTGRDKSHDYFDNFEDTKAESKIFDKVYRKFHTQMHNPLKGNHMLRLKNNFDEESTENFVLSMNTIVNSVPILG